MSAPLLVELFTEELPPKALQRLSEAFAGGIVDGLRAQGLVSADVAVERFSTPRRLAVRIASTQANAPDRSQSKKLMPVKVGLDADGKPTPALIKRLEKEGATAEHIQRRVEGDAEYVFLEQKLKGVSLARGLQSALDDAIAKLPTPKRMSYQLVDGETTVQFVRPAHGLVALHGDKVIAVSALGLTAGNVTHGHRFQGVRDIPIKTALLYEGELKTHGNVIASFELRREEVAKQLRAAAAKLKLSTGDDGGVSTLLDEVTALVENPAVYAGEFDADFLSVPQECLILTMRANQKYFPLFGADGKLANKFLIVSNMQIDDPRHIIEGNERVVRPRLSDARFFFETDKKTRLADRIPQLAKITYQQKLGSQIDRVERVRAISREIAGSLGADLTQVDRAALLAKADLHTHMVGEFPELQGVMGKYYARHDGELDVVARAIEAHYLPRFAGDALPEELVSVSVALADKLETIAGMFGVGEQPKGDKDPYALRRNAIGMIRIMIEKKLNVSIRPLVDIAILAMPANANSDWLELVQFILDRAKSYFLDQGYSSLAIDAVLKPFGSVSWLHTLPEIVAEASRFIATEEGKILIGANKRITNILKKSGFEVPFGFAPDALPTKPNSTLFRHKAEFDLWSALEVIGGESLNLKREQRFADSLRVLSRLGQPTKAFFDHVMVNVEEKELQENRITLLQHARAYMNQVADLSMMVP